MNTETGQVGVLTDAETATAMERMNRALRPGDKVTDDPADPRVVISGVAARKLALAANALRQQERDRRRRKERKLTKHEKGRTGRKRREARHRANGELP